MLRYGKWRRMGSTRKGQRAQPRIPKDEKTEKRDRDGLYPF